MQQNVMGCLLIPLLIQLVEDIHLVQHKHDGSSAVDISVNSACTLCNRLVMCLSAAFEICLDVETGTAIVKSNSMFSFDMG